MASYGGVPSPPASFCVEIHLPSFLFLLLWVFFFFFFIGCTVNAWADYCCKRWKQHKTVVSLGPFSLCPSHSSLTRVNHYISFSDSLYLLCIDIHMQGNKNACFFLFLKELVSCCLYCYANFISSLNDISWVFAMTLLKEYHIMILV